MDVVIITCLVAVAAYAYGGYRARAKWRCAICGQLPMVFWCSSCFELDEEAQPTRLSRWEDKL